MEAIKWELLYSCQTAHKGDAAKWKKKNEKEPFTQDAAKYEPKPQLEMPPHLGIVEKENFQPGGTPLPRAQ